MKSDVDLLADDDDPRVLAAVQEYLTALESSPRPDRRAFVNRHPEIAAELSPYLDALDMVHSAAPLLHSSPEIVPMSAEPLGDFRLVREIGRGGMGIVYEANQMSLGRRVALKILPFASGLDPKHLQRFKTEAHAAAQLHHTNIVPVHAVGCERGVHFYAMQLIEGRPLDTVIDEMQANPVIRTTGSTVDQVGRTLGSTTRTGRTREVYRTVARMVLQIAEALEYAHDAGVIHRDIKPANLLLDAKGIVWVTDFGLAQIAADVGMTQTGDIFGTLRYMSPEQAGGKRLLVDHRTDVYSLGATMYELLTLEPMFPGQDRQTLLNQILNEEPKSPRAIERSIPVELETIVLKSIAKSPVDRYTTAGEMAADLRRFLDERPILARRPTLIDRGRKWMRRHPSIIGAAVIVLVFGVIGLAASTALIAQEQSRTKDAYHREQQRALEAEQRFQLARRSVDEMIQFSQEEMSDNPFLHRTRKRMLESALVYYQEFIELRRDDPDAQAELAATRNYVQKIVADLAVLQKANELPMLNEAVIVDDLKLNADQRKRLTDLLQTINQPKSDPQNMSLEERQSKFVERVRTNDALLAKILTPAQFVRLRQIALQCQGVLAFRDPDVVAALKITPEQRSRLRAIDVNIFFGKPERRGPPGQEGPPRPPGPSHEQNYRELMERIQAVLTEEQRIRWKEMTGEPFTAARTLEFRFHRPFGGPR